MTFIHSQPAENYLPTDDIHHVTVEFTFDSKYIKADTDVVVFESLYHNGKELAVHTDINDEGQTVTVKVPEIKTTANIGGEKEITAKDEITIDDIVEYRNLTVGKEYKIIGTLMDKSTGKPFRIKGKTVTSEVVFTPEKSDGQIIVSFTFDGKYIKESTEFVVFETLYRDNVEIAVHTDINDVKYVYDISQTNALPDPEKPKKYDDRTLVSALLATAKIEKVVAPELPISDSCAFYDSENNTLVLKEKGGSGAKLFQDIARELTLSEIAYNSDEYNRSECEFSAECSVYMICKKYGIDTQGLNLNSVPKEWENKENKDVRLNLTMARDSLNTIGSRMYAVLNRDKEPKQQEQSR